MKITVKFETQVRRAAGVSATCMEVDETSTLEHLIQRLGQESQEQLRSVLLNETGEIRPTVMLFLDDEYIPIPNGQPLKDVSRLTIMSPISGG